LQLWQEPRPQCDYRRTIPAASIKTDDVESILPLPMPIEAMVVIDLLEIAVFRLTLVHSSVTR
jgi:hypothetical protein